MYHDLFDWGQSVLWRNLRSWQSQVNVTFKFETVGLFAGDIANHAGNGRL
jgi:hypothetical protein